MGGLEAKRLQTLEDDMTTANEEYIQAVNRASEPFGFGFPRISLNFTS